MKAAWISFLTLLCISLADLGEFVLKPEIAEAFRKRNPYDPPNISKYATGTEPFIAYVLENWREIVDNIECIPMMNQSPVRDITDEVRLNSSLSVFAGTCQELPPVEYVEFFNKMLNLCDEGRVPFRAIETAYSSLGTKDYFFAVNWEHPEVQKIFAKMKRLIPPENDSLLSLVEKEEKGDLADNYLTNREDDAPLPQTLPGIRLKRPFGSLIRKYERLTGTKVPPDPDFPEEPQIRPSKRNPAASGEPEQTLANADADEKSGIPWTLVAAAIAGLLVLMAVAKSALKKWR